MNLQGGTEEMLFKVSSVLHGTTLYHQHLDVASLCLHAGVPSDALLRVAHLTGSFISPTPRMSVDYTVEFSSY